MPFHIDRFKEFLVRPALPDGLARLSELAYNLLWSWDLTIRGLFRRLDPELWTSCGHNPVSMLGRLPQAAFEDAADDQRFLAAYKRACERLDSYLKRDTPRGSKLIAYFSMEYGLAECLNIYSGGLGILSGDHLKGASDADIPMVAIGLLYQKGYFQQSLNPDGWQQERYPVNDFYTLPVLPVQEANGRDLHVEVQLPGGAVQIKVWQANVGRVKLYLLDTNISENPQQADRDITDYLYGGDAHTRMRQEIVLGVGGLRALQALGLEPTVYHMNEGHSAFLAIERIRLLMQARGMRFEEALDASRVNNVFTTHTSVPAGIDVFHRDLMAEYFNAYCQRHGIELEQILSLGRWDPNNRQEQFSMAICAFSTSSFRNAVSLLHRSVSQSMWQDLWPGLPVWEVPITSVTNGVHLPSWLNRDLASVYDNYLQPDWRERYTEPQIWEQVDEIPDRELWEAHRLRKRRLVSFVRERAAAAAPKNASKAELRRLSGILDPEVFTIGFARRMATYKRPKLIFQDLERLKKLVMSPTTPLQIVIAGKAHPKDTPGKEMLREIALICREPELQKRVVFVENYDIEVGRALVHGVDVWLNNPRRGEEACGTSGMKAAVNGIPNLSILDGWFDEAYEYSGGWAIGERIPYEVDQDPLHAGAIYSLLENEILPMYYQHREEGVPVEWVKRMKLSLKNVCPKFNCQQMLAEYSSELYAPAHRAYEETRADDYAAGRERAQWKRRVQDAWERVRFLATGPDLAEPLVNGSALEFRAVLDLAGLKPDDVRVEIVVGNIRGERGLEDTEVITMASAGQQGEGYVFSKNYMPVQTGRLGYAMRVSPNHSDDPLKRPCHALIRWSA